ncbi:MAG: DNA polymerase Y family protein [Caulobacteraceae bacterium]|nr:DNA polymerase Y family protein [Caulobacteraceae bacterium]
MRRVVSLYLPTWPTDRWRRRLGKNPPPAEAPVILVGRVARKRLVVAADAAALALQLEPGMAATQARALCAELIVDDADPDGDAAALDQLALWALKLYAPIVAVDPPAGLVVDATGAAHLFGGEQGLLDDMVARLARAGYAAQAAMAGTWGAAHALARFVARPTMIVPSDQSGRAIAHLPTWALRLPDGMADALGKMGIDTIGEIEAKPRAPLALRFGPELTRRLDQAYGRASEPIETVELPELIQIRRAFAEPIGAPETLARYTLKLVEALCQALEAKGLGARTLDLRFHRVDNRIEVIRVGLSKPTRTIKQLTRLLCDKLETIDPGFGVETMVLAAPSAEPLTWKPVASDLTEPAVPDVADLVDTLANRLGAGRLYRVAPAQSDVPERSVRKLEPTAPPTGETWPAHWPRPARLLARPEKIETLALLPDQPPTAFTWRGVRRRVKRADGPERIFGEWWRRDGEVDAVRDYFQLEDEAGERFWVYRRGDGEQPETGDLSWFMHGLFG